MTELEKLQVDLSGYGPRPWLREQSVWAVLTYRLGRALDEAPRRPWTPMLRLLWWLAYRAVETATGITLPKSAEFGPGLRIWHFGGIVIGEGQKVGANCTLRHNVTIGPQHADGALPVIGDDLNMGPGSMILGPIRVGDNVEVGAMSLVIKDVPAGAIVAGVPARQIGTRAAGEAPSPV